MSGEGDDFDQRLNAVREEVAQIRAELESIKAHALASDVRKDHRSGRHGGASIPWCPFCDREMTPGMLPGYRTARGPNPGASGRPWVGGLNDFIAALRLADEDDLLAVVAPFSRPVEPAADPEAATAALIDRFLRSSASLVFRPMKCCVGLLFRRQDPAEVATILNAGMEDADDPGLDIQAVLLAATGTADQRTARFSSVVRHITQDKPFLIGRPGGRRVLGM